MITVFYDDQCNLCNKEINYYRKIAPNGIFKWQKITHSVEQLNRANINLADALKKLHVKNHDGTYHIGIDGFILIWKNLKKWHILAVFISLPIIYQITKIIYSLFAHWRFNKLKHCKL